jgi:hypothetical protein
MSNQEKGWRDGETILKQFLELLNEHVFVNSVNSVTTKEEKLNPVIEDMEAIIKICGEWDREDLKGMLYTLCSSVESSAIRKAYLDAAKIVEDFEKHPCWAIFKEKHGELVKHNFIYLQHLIERNIDAEEWAEKEKQLIADGKLEQKGNKQ